MGKTWLEAFSRSVLVTRITVPGPALGRRVFGATGTTGAFGMLQRLLSWAG